MSVKAALERAKLNQDKELKEKEIDVTKQGQKRNFFSSVIGSVSSLLPKGKYTLGNGPVWYKQYIKDIEAVTNIPTWLRVSQPNVHTTGGKFSASSAIQLFSASADRLRPYGSAYSAVSPKVENNATGSTARVVVHKFMPHPGLNSEVIDNGNYGYSISSQDWPINRATLMTITELGKLNSRAIPNDPSIPGMYLLAGTDIYSFLSEIKFVIDTATHYQDNDTSIPDAILVAKGYDPAEVRSNLPSYRKMYRILREAALSLIPMPDDFTLLARRIWMNTVIIRDTENSKACLNLFAQEAFGVITEDGVELNYNAFNNSNDTGYVKLSYARIEGYLNRMIANISTNEDFLTLISNMRAANIKFAPLPELEYSVNYEIMANDEVKLQLQNIVTFPSSYYSRGGEYSHLTTSKLNDWTITHDSSGYVYGPRSFVLSSDTIAADGKFTSVVYAGTFLRAYAETRVLSSFSQLFNSFIGWDSDKMLVATRLHPLFSGFSAYNGDTRKFEQCLDITACGTELVLNTFIYCMGLDSNGDVEMKEHPVFTVALSVPTVTITGTKYKVTAWYNNLSLDSDRFRDIIHVDGFYPIYVMHTNMVGFEWDVSDGSIINDAEFSTSILFEADDFITIGRVDLSKIHEVCVLSEYFIPAQNFGSFTRSK